MQLPLRLGIRPSRVLTGILVLLYVMGLFALMALNMPGWSKIGLAVAAIWSGLIAVRHHGLGADPASVRELLLKADGTLEGLRADGQRFEAKVVRHSTVLPWLVVMQLEHLASNRRLAMTLLPDSLSPQEFRQLLTWMRWQVV
jgi:hypothetical protein